jgi:glycosyltransferase involved in cell wall biosynthesis
MRGLLPAVFSRLAACLIAPAQNIALNIMGPSAPHVHIVPNAVDDSFFEEERSIEDARAFFGLSVRNAAVIGVPGTLRPMKGHSFFLEAAAELLEKCPHVQIAITGGGEEHYLHQLKRQVDHHGLADRVRFLGVVTDMPAFYRACDVICVPSVAEPFGRTVIEAFAVGAPVVATAVGGIRETIEDGITGITVPYGDVSALATALNDVLHDKLFSYRLSTAAHGVARNMYHASMYQKNISVLVNTYGTAS